MYEVGHNGEWKYDDGVEGDWHFGRLGDTHAVFG
jgi:hypothetical protein